MSIFSSILQKIGIGKPAATAPANPAADAAAKAQADAAVGAAMAKAAEEAKARVAAAQAKAAADAKAATASSSVASASTVGSPSIAPAFVAAPVPSTPVQSAAIPVVDVVTKLEGLASSHPGLNWKVSIVDLLKLLDIDSGFESRKELATELGCPADMMNDSARMNTWLHKTVLQKIAENGGNIPASLLD